MAGKVENRGGKRPNQTGRPRKQPEPAAVRKLQSAARKMAKEEGENQGRTPEEVLLAFAYRTGFGKRASPDQQLRALQTYFKHTTPIQTEQKIDDKREKGPAIYLPEQLPDPAQEIPKAEDAEEKVAH